MITSANFKEHIGGIQTELDFTTVLPFVNSAAMWFRKEIGNELYTLLAGTPPANSNPDYQMYYLARACVSWRAYELAFPHLKIRVGDVGMMKNSPANTISITKWEYTDTMDSIRKMLDQNLEYFWDEVESRKPTTWTGSLNYQVRQELFINSAAQMDKYVGIVGNNARLFNKLVLHILRAEQHYIKRIATSGVVQALKAKLSDSSPTLTVQEAELVELIRQAIAPLALYEAYPHLSLVVDENGIRQARLKDGTSEQEFPEAGLRNAQRQQLFNDGQLYLANIKSYLNANATASVFPSYYTAYLADGMPAGDLYEDQKDHSQIVL